VGDLLMQSELATHSTLEFKKTNIFLMVILSIVTIGIYNAYWFLSRKKYFKNLNTKNVIPYKWWIFMLIYLILSLLYSLFGPVFFTEYGIAVLDSIDIILAFYFVGCLNYSVFRAREMIEDYFEEEIFQSWLLVVFNIWYLQYKINRLVDSGGNL
jgi:membrane-associated HD superfamily phosphohydrolase